MFWACLSEKMQAYDQGTPVVLLEPAPHFWELPAVVPPDFPPLL